LVNKGRIPIESFAKSAVEIMRYKHDLDKGFHSNRYTKGESLKEAVDAMLELYQLSDKVKDINIDARFQGG